MIIEIRRPRRGLQCVLCLQCMHSLQIAVPELVTPRQLKQRPFPDDIYLLAWKIAGMIDVADPVAKRVRVSKQLFFIGKVFVSLKSQDCKLQAQYLT